MSPDLRPPGPEPTPVPDDVKDAALVARTLEAKARRTREEEEAMNRARLKVAFWACRREGVYASWENLCHVLGPHADAIRPAYEQLLTEQDGTEARRPRPAAPVRKIKEVRKRAAETGMFWGGGRTDDASRKKD